MSTLALQAGSGAYVRHRRPVLAWAGCVLLAAGAIWLMILGGTALAAEPDAGHALYVAVGRMVGPALLVTVAVLFTLERLRPAVARPARSRSHLVDGAYLAVFAVIAPLVVLLNTGFAVVVREYAPFLVLGRLPVSSQALVSAPVLIGMDGVNWAVHVGNHRFRSLWRFHALHHSQEEMSVLTTFRTHPLAHVSYAPAVLPALVLAASGGLPGWTLVAYGCLVTLPHSNLAWTLGPAGRLLVSPAYHRLHHASAPVGSGPVVNFGFALTVWDHLAGLAVQPGGTSPVPTGLTGRPVPVEQALPAQRVAAVVARQLSQPFRINDAMEARS